MNVTTKWTEMPYSTEKYSSTFISTFTFTCSTIGLVLAVTALLLLVLTAILFAEWRKTYKNQLLIQFMIARFFYMIARYAYDVMNFLNIGSRYFTPIYLDMITMGYTEMAVVTWMFVFSKQMYENFVIVFTGSTNIVKVSVYAWLIPAAISIIVYLIYMLQDGKDIQIFILYCTFIKLPLLFANGTLLVSVLKSILSTNRSKTANNRKIIFVMILLIFTFCCQQAMSDIYKLVYFIYHSDKKVLSRPLIFVFFNILTAYHCAFSILFWLFGNKRTRMLWVCFVKKSNQNLSFRDITLHI